MVRAYFYAVLVWSFRLEFFLDALHAPSYFILCSSLSYKCHFPSKISTSLCLHSLCSFSLRLYHQFEVVLNMHPCIYLFFFFAFLSFNFLQLHCMFAPWLLPIQIGTGHMIQHYLFLDFGLKSTLLEDVTYIQTINDMENIQWNCALCICRQKSIYLCGPSRLSSLYLFKFETNCKSQNLCIQLSHQTGDGMGAVLSCLTPHSFVN